LSVRRVQPPERVGQLARLQVGEESHFEDHGVVAAVVTTDDADDVVERQNPVAAATAASG
jgi:hypothetical protein